MVTFKLPASCYRLYCGRTQVGRVDDFHDALVAFALAQREPHR